FPAIDRLQLLEQIRSQEPLRPRALDPRIPRDLETIVLKAIDKDPGRRYQSANDLAEDLRRFLADEPIKARRSSLRERAWRWCRRNPVIAGLLGLVLLAFATGAVISGYYARESGIRAIEADRKAGEAVQARAETLSQLCDSYLQEARGLRLSRRPG